MKPIAKWTFWQRRISTIWWGTGTFSLIALTLAFYPAFKDQGEALQKSFDSLPDSAVQLFGGSTDFFSPVGYLNSQLFFIVIPLLFSILAISLGSTLVAREEQDHTVEALLARPISRSQLLFGKVVAGVSILGLVTVVGFLTTALLCRLTGLHIPIMNLAVVCGASFMLALSFGAIAFLLTAIGRAKGISLGLTTAIALGGYIISSLAGTAHWLNTPSRIFPFHYYRSEEILNGTYVWSPIFILFVFSLLCVGLAWLAFRRRDLS
jgi:ABC-2 type transport system permease protein